MLGKQNMFYLAYKQIFLCFIEMKFFVGKVFEILSLIIFLNKTEFLLSLKCVRHAFKINSEPSRVCLNMLSELEL